MRELVASKPTRICSPRTTSDWARAALYVACLAVGPGALACQRSATETTERSQPSQTNRLEETAAFDPDALTDAERAFLDGRLDRTVQHLRNDRRDATDGLLLAYALLMQGDEEAATTVLDQTMQAPLFADEHLFNGLFAIVTGDLDAALEQLALQVQQPRRRLFSAVLHVEILILAERFEEADAEIRALVDALPEEPLVHHTLGHLELARENWTEVLAAYGRAVDLGGPNPDLDEGFAIAHTGLGQYSLARAAIERCRAAFPDYGEILFQAIRLAREAPEHAIAPIDALISEYRAQARRPDRLAQVDEWMSGP